MRYDLNHMYRNPAAYRDVDFSAAAVERGWVLKRIRGSHHMYSKWGWPVTLSVAAGVQANGTKRAIARALMDEEARSG